MIFFTKPKLIRPVIVRPRLELFYSSINMEKQKFI